MVQEKGGWCINISLGIIVSFFQKTLMINSTFEKNLSCTYYNWCATEFWGGNRGTTTKSQDSIGFFSTHTGLKWKWCEMYMKEWGYNNHKEKEQSNIGELWWGVAVGTYEGPLDISMFTHSPIRVLLPIQAVCVLTTELLFRLKGGKEKKKTNLHCMLVL